MMKTNTLTLALLLLVLSCEPVSKEVLIDNPSDQAITLFLDGEAPIIIGPRATKAVVTRFGHRSIRIDDGPSVRIHLRTHKEYLLNPLRANYHLQEERIARSRGADHQVPVTVIGNFQFEGVFTDLGNDLVLERCWKYGPGERTGGEGSDLTGALYRESDLIRTAQEEFVNSLQSISYTPLTE